MDNLRKHAKYSASATGRWFKCPGSVRLAEVYPERGRRPSAEDGTEAHALLEFCLMGGIRKSRDGYFGGKFSFEYRQDSFDERMDAVQVALDHAYSILDAYEDAELHLEVSFQFPSTAAPGEAFGTADIVILVPSVGYIYVIDYKHGYIIVEVENNSQMLTYANGVIAHFDPGYQRFANLCLTVIQPRPYHPDGPIREWYTDVSTALEFIPLFDMHVRAAQAPDAPLVPSADPQEGQCRFCPAYAHCPAVEAKALSLVGTHFRGVKDITRDKLPEPKVLGLERLVYIMLARPVIEGWFSAVEDCLYNIAMEGTYVPDHKLVEANARRTWDDNHDEIAGLLMVYLGSDNEDEVRPRKLLPITDAERKLKAHFKATLGLKGRGGQNKSAEMASQIMAEFTTKASSGKLVLTHTSDPRPPVNRAQRDFQAFKTIDGTATRNEQ